jgi:uncharacterized integral membrane protein (TIGR00698 family)
VGSAICGATAIVATGPVIEAKEEELAYAVANITIFGVVAMLFYPYLAHAIFGSDTTGAGLFLGTSIHETAQVAGSGLIYAQVFDLPKALDIATVTKLVRNVFIAAVVPLMAYFYARREAEPGREKAEVSLIKLFPLFILGFLALAVFRTLGDSTLAGGAAYGLLDKSAWSSLVGTIQGVAEALLAMAMAAVGLGTSLNQLRGLGLRPFYVGFAAAASVGVLSIVGIALLRALGVS